MYTSKSIQACIAWKQEGPVGDTPYGARNMLGFPCVKEQQHRKSVKEGQRESCWLGEADLEPKANDAM